MKQAEKLDFVLKSLYSTSDKRGEILSIFKEKGFDITLDDAYIIGRRLEGAGYVDFAGTKDSAYVDLTSEGIEFVEGNSFTHKGQSVINNNYINNSPNANLINQSSGVNISQQNQSEIKQTLSRIKEAINADTSVDGSKRQDVLELIQEIEHGIDTGRPPKFAFKSFIEIGSDIASIASLVMQVATLMPGA